LILDEGTSALDGINEKRLLRNLKERSNIQFIIMIAHRTETLAEASTIIKVEKGGV
jgi:ABC-type bacteriocin/lantibiotic exporter with double-glycine peptidase domain